MGEPAGALAVVPFQAPEQDRPDPGWKARQDVPQLALKAYVPKPKGTLGGREPKKGGSHVAIIGKVDARVDILATKKASKPSQGGQMVEVFRPGEMNWLPFLQMILTAGESVLCALTFIDVTMAQRNPYNMFDVWLNIYDAIIVAFLWFTIVGVFAFVCLLAFVECLKKRLFHKIMAIRMVFSSVPCAVLGTVIVLLSEGRHPLAVVTALWVLFGTGLYCATLKVQWFQILSTRARVLVDVGLFLSVLTFCAVAIVFATGTTGDVIGRSAFECAVNSNEKMPVYIPPLQEWTCASWSESETIFRQPQNSEPIKLSCADTFVGLFGVSMNSHQVECPRGCLQLAAAESEFSATAAKVVGCGAYSEDSSVCLSAVHAGALPSTGGVTTVYGRVGLAGFTACTRNSVASQSREVADGGSSVVGVPVTGAGGRMLQSVTPRVVTSTGAVVPNAFHFNNLPSTREFVHLESFSVTASDDIGVVDGETWSRLQAVVTSRIAGVEVNSGAVRLGSYGNVELVPGGSNSRTIDSRCFLSATGVDCTEHGHAAVQLDVCQPEC